MTICFTPLHAQQQKGKASYYSKRATGARTSSGEKLHHDSLTCAHRTYPFGTLLKVTNPGNGKSVVVKVTDRGPFRKGRIIDLSYRAAKEIEMLGQGVAMVAVEPANLTIIPFKPNDKIDLPTLELESTDRRNYTKPEWQDLKEVQEKAHKKPTLKSAPKPAPKLATKPVPTSAIKTAAKPIRQQGASPATAQTPSKHQETDVLNEINSKPNVSRAYSKRQKNK
jgi:rare lipoprotein A